MSDGYLSEEQLDNLEGLVGHTPTSVEVYYWRMESEAPLLDYVQLNFDDRDAVVLRVGSISENVDVVSTDELESGLERRGRAVFIKTVLQEGPKWRGLLHHVILKVTLKDEKGYAHSSIVFHTAAGATEITTGVDVLEVIPPAGSDL